MKLTQVLQADASLQLERTGIPRKVLRHVLRSHRIAVGSRILDVGCGRGELVQYFSRLGIDAVGCDPSAVNVSVARRLAPRLDFYCGGWESDEISELRFDLVLARVVSPFSESLNGRQAVRAYAGLMSCVRPGGHLVILDRQQDAASSSSGGHSESCYRQLQLRFPGSHSTSHLWDGLIDSTSWKRALRPSTILASHQSPERPITRFDWMSHVDTDTLSHVGPCCSEAERQRAA